MALTKLLNATKCWEIFLKGTFLLSYGWLIIFFKRGYAIILHCGFHISFKCLDSIIQPFLSPSSFR